MALKLAPVGAVLDVMRRLVADPNSRVRLIAAGSLLSAESSNTNAGIVLREALEDPALRVREAALELLESLGASGAALLEGLRERDGEPGIVGSYGPLHPTPEGAGDPRVCILPDTGRSPAGGEMR